MRIIGGNLRGRKLASLRGMAIRPTADRVREALFNILGRKSLQASVLDVFAGSGALGIEALSRGAREAVFVDKSSAALRVVDQNLKLCRLETCSQVLRWDAVKNLNCLLGYQERFSLIFLDPPYNKGLITPVLKHLMDQQLTAPEVTIIVEHDPAEIVTCPSDQWTTTDQRRYGQTQLSFIQRR